MSKRMSRFLSLVFSVILLVSTVGQDALAAGLTTDNGLELTQVVEEVPAESETDEDKTDEAEEVQADAGEADADTTEMSETDAGEADADEAQVDEAPAADSDKTEGVADGEPVPVQVSGAETTVTGGVGYTTIDIAAHDESQAKATISYKDSENGNWVSLTGNSGTISITAGNELYLRIIPEDGYCFDLYDPTDDSNPNGETACHGLYMKQVATYNLEGNSVAGDLMVGWLDDVGTISLASDAGVKIEYIDGAYLGADYTFRYKLVSMLDANNGPAYFGWDVTNNNTIDLYLKTDYSDLVKASPYRSAASYVNDFLIPALTGHKGASQKILNDRLLREKSNANSDTVITKISTYADFDSNKSMTVSSNLLNAVIKFMDPAYDDGGGCANRIEILPNQNGDDSYRQNCSAAFNNGQMFDINIAELDLSKSLTADTSYTFKGQLSADTTNNLFVTKFDFPAELTALGQASLRFMTSNSDLIAFAKASGMVNSDGTGNSKELEILNSNGDIVGRAWGNYNSYTWHNNDNDQDVTNEELYISLDITADLAGTDKTYYLRKAVYCGDVRLTTPFGNDGPACMQLYVDVTELLSEYNESGYSDGLAKYMSEIFATNALKKVEAYRKANDASDMVLQAVTLSNIPSAVSLVNGADISVKLGIQGGGYEWYNKLIAAMDGIDDENGNHRNPTISFHGGDWIVSAFVNVMGATALKAEPSFEGVFTPNDETGFKFVYTKNGFEVAQVDDTQDRNPPQITFGVSSAGFTSLVEKFRGEDGYGSILWLYDEDGVMYQCSGINMNLGSYWSNGSQTTIGQIEINRIDQLPLGNYHTEEKKFYGNIWTFKADESNPSAPTQIQVNVNWSDLLREKNKTTFTLSKYISDIFVPNVTAYVNLLKKEYTDEEPPISRIDISGDFCTINEDNSVYFRAPLSDIGEDGWNALAGIISNGYNYSGSQIPGCITFTDNSDKTNFVSLVLDGPKTLETTARVLDCTALVEQGDDHILEVSEFNPGTEDAADDIALTYSSTALVDTLNSFSNSNCLSVYVGDVVQENAHVNTWVNNDWDHDDDGNPINVGVIHINGLYSINTDYCFYVDRAPGSGQFGDGRLQIRNETFLNDELQQDEEVTFYALHLGPWDNQYDASTSGTLEKYYEGLLDEYYELLSEDADYPVGEVRITLPFASTTTTISKELWNKAVKLLDCFDYAYSRIAIENTYKEEVGNNVYYRTRTQYSVINPHVISVNFVANVIAEIGTDVNAGSIVGPSVTVKKLAGLSSKDQLSYSNYFQSEDEIARLADWHRYMSEDWVTCSLTTETGVVPSVPFAQSEYREANENENTDLEACIYVEDITDLAASTKYYLVKEGRYVLGDICLEIGTQLDLNDVLPTGYSVVSVKTDTPWDIRVDGSKLTALYGGGNRALTVTVNKTGTNKKYTFTDRINIIQGDVTSIAFEESEIELGCWYEDGEIHYENRTISFPSVTPDGNNCDEFRNEFEISVCWLNDLGEFVTYSDSNSPLECIKNDNDISISPNPADYDYTAGAEVYIRCSLYNRYLSSSDGGLAFDSDGRLIPGDDAQLLTTYLKVKIRAFDEPVLGDIKNIVYLVAPGTKLAEIDLNSIETVNLRGIAGNWTWDNPTLDLSKQFGAGNVTAWVAYSATFTSDNGNVYHYTIPLVLYNLAAQCVFNINYEYMTDDSTVAIVESDSEKRLLLATFYDKDKYWGLYSGYDTDHHYIKDAVNLQDYRFVYDLTRSVKKKNGKTETTSLAETVRYSISESFRSPSPSFDISEVTVGAANITVKLEKKSAETEEWTLVGGVLDTFAVKFIDDPGYISYFGFSGAGVIDLEEEGYQKVNLLQNTDKIINVVLDTTNLDLENADVSITSGDTSIAKVKSQETGEVTLTGKTGVVTFTVTVKKNGKSYTKKAVLKVVKPIVTVENDFLLYATEKESLGNSLGEIRVSEEDYEAKLAIKDPASSPAKYFGFNSDDNVLTLTEEGRTAILADKKLKKGFTKDIVFLATERETGESLGEITVTVCVDTSQPELTVLSGGNKINLFYTYDMDEHKAVAMVSSYDNVTSIAVDEESTDCAYTVAFDPEYQEMTMRHNGTSSLQIKDKYTKCNLVYKVAGYRGTYKVPYKFPVVNKAESYYVERTAYTIYGDYGDPYFTFMPTRTESIGGLSFVSGTLEVKPNNKRAKSLNCSVEFVPSEYDEENGTETEAYYRITPQINIASLKKAKTEKWELWAQPIYATKQIKIATFTITVNPKQPTLYLSKTQFTLNNYTNADGTGRLYENVEADLSITGTDMTLYDTGVHITGRDSASIDALSQLNIGVDGDCGLHISLKSKNTLAAKTYKYRITYEEADMTLTKDFEIKVINKKPSVKLSKKTGGIQILNPESYISYVVDPSNIAGKVDVVRLEGADGYKFEVVYNEKTKRINIYHKEGERVCDSIAYVDVIVEFDSGASYEYKKLKLDLTNGTPTVRTEKPFATWKQNSNPEYLMAMSADISKARLDVEIDTIRLVNYTDDFAVNILRSEENPDYVEGVELYRTGFSKAIKPGTYKLKFEVTFKNSLPTAKPVTITVPVKIAYN